MHITFAGPDDFDFLIEMDLQVRGYVLQRKMERQEVLIVWHDDLRAGWLR
jgi:hypothetical protein